MVRYSVLLVTKNDKGNGSECKFQQNISECCVDFYYVLLNAFVDLTIDTHLEIKKQSSFISLKNMLLHTCISDMHGVITFTVCFEDEE